MKSLFSNVTVAAAAAALLCGCAAPPNINAVSSAPQAELLTLKPGRIEVVTDVPGARATLASTLERHLREQLGQCMTGTTPADVKVRVEWYKEQEGAVTIMLGDATQLAGPLILSDPATGRVLGEYYVDELRFKGGLIGAAMLADAENSLSADYARNVCKVVFGKG